ncbi:hypothetical protein Ddye_027300, partial [Dipteronia dyeriana]
VGLKMFLGINATVTNWDADGICCNIILEDNPLVKFVELPRRGEENDNRFHELVK